MSVSEQDTKFLTGPLRTYSKEEDKRYKWQESTGRNEVPATLLGLPRRHPGELRTNGRYALHSRAIKKEKEKVRERKNTTE